MNEVAKIIQQIISQQFNLEIEVNLTRPRPEFGDFATNIAMQLAGKLGKNPREIAEILSAEIAKTPIIKKVEVAGAGFINLTVHDDFWSNELQINHPKFYENQTVLVEYSDPNAFKVLHAGHLYTSVIGDAIANLVEVGGGNVKRLNFGGDVGLHVGKTMWAILKQTSSDFEKLADVPANERADWLAARYVEGTNAYEEDEQAKAEIVEINKAVYKIHKDNDHESNLAKFYWETREWSYDYFKDFYKRIGSHFDKFYPESMVADRGYEEVKKHIGDVFEESNGAIIFDGEKHGLHTRVFINGEGIPTYEAKDVGLIHHKYDDWKFDRSIIITADEQKHYMAVVLKALEQFAPKLALATTHITHGIVKLAGGVKMSSRKGNFLRAVDVIDFANQANREQNGEADEKVSLGAVKYAFLKQKIGGDVIYDPKESVSIVGNSGPYLQYAHARACSVLAKAGEFEKVDFAQVEFDDQERQFVQKLAEYNGVVAKASLELLPHLICTYLYEVAQEFNRFYEKSRIIGDERQQIRLNLVEIYRDILADGLKILSIDAPERM